MTLSTVTHICFRNDHGYFLIPFAVMTIRVFHHSWLINSFVIRVKQSLVGASKGAPCSRIMLFRIDPFRWSETIVHSSLSNSGTGPILYCTFFWWFDCQMTQPPRIEYVGEFRSWHKVVTCDLPLHLWSVMNPIASNEPRVMSLDLSFALSFHFLMFVFVFVIDSYWQCT